MDTYKKYAEVYIDIKTLSIDHPFDYRIPHDLSRDIYTGVIVRVPFKNRVEVGYVVKTKDKSELEDNEIKDIIKVIDSKPVFDPAKLKLIDWVGNYYVQPLGSVIKFFLPPGGKYKGSSKGAGIKLKFKEYVFLNKEKYRGLMDGINWKKNYKQKKIVDYLFLQGEVLKEKLILDTESCYSSLRGLLEKNIISIIKKREKKAFVLTPEISLIPQLFSRFESEFGSRVCVYHSNMSEAERYERWLDIWDNRFDIVIGTRSSIFTPLNNPGIIILDEEHDTSYKEGTGVRYNTREESIKMGEILSIPVVFGSATPGIVTRFKAEKEKDFTLLKIPIKAQSSSPVEMEIIDLKNIDHLKEDITITGKLFTAIREELEKNNKVIIFLNRRGYSNFIICNKCGNVPKCPACDLSYNYHSDPRKLGCHHCGREQNYSGKCPVCGADNIFLYGTGIQKVQSKLQMRFKDAPILRMDSDATVKKKSHQEILNKFISPGGSILIGTQMIAKGLDIEDVTLVGIINCDSMLGLPDYHMNERVYQLITQVSGRAGRKRKKGRVIIQTYNPESSVMKNVLGNDYESFYRQELGNRKELCYPPFSNLVNIIISGKDENIVKKDIGELFDRVVEAAGNCCSILGPAPAPFHKINLFYRWHIIIKSKNMDFLNEALAKILKRFKKFDENKIIIDVDPVWIL